MEPIRLALAQAALLVPAVAFAANAFISYRERGFVEPYDVPAAVGFLLVAVLAWRRSLVALVGGIALCAIYLATVLTAGPAAFIAFWIVALALTAQALPLMRPRSRTSST
ncbi:MAG TPA: hypothetical protein VGR87_06925 [Candidatus Limnocylindria bacterium]|jgi:hypothetical protein|nr:hypothetical protein [Candidatus Limnocylindria bacterium]